MKYTEINIKENMPVVADAMQYLKDSLTRLKRDKYGCVLIVHGYGSTGKAAPSAKPRGSGLRRRRKTAN